MTAGDDEDRKPQPYITGEGFVVIRLTQAESEHFVQEWRRRLMEAAKAAGAGARKSAVFGRPEAPPPGLCPAPHPPAKDD